MEVYVSIYSEFHTFLTAYLVILKDLRLLVVWGKSNKNKTVYVIKKTRPHLKSLRQPNQNLVPKKLAFCYLLQSPLTQICNQSAINLANLVIISYTPCVFHVETTWKRSFPRRFNVESRWCVWRDMNKYSNNFLGRLYVANSYSIFC